MRKDMTIGNPMKIILLFSLPVLLGNLFQQFYNMVDTVIVGQYLGEDALGRRRFYGLPDVSGSRFRQRNCPGIRCHGIPCIRCQRHEASPSLRSTFTAFNGCNFHDSDRSYGCVFPPAASVAEYSGKYHHTGKPVHPGHLCRYLCYHGI